MTSSPFIKVYKRVVPINTCKKIVQAFEDSPYKINGLTGGGYQPQIKKSTDLMISPELRGKEPQWEEFDKIIFEAFSKCLTKYRKDTPGGLEYIYGGIQDTGYGIKRYMNEGEEQYRWHGDATSHNTSHRFLVMLLALNTVKEGGETDFKYYPDNSFKPIAGSILVFPTGFTYVHRGAPPISNPKYNVNTFFEVKPSEGSIVKTSKDK